MLTDKIRSEMNSALKSGNRERKNAHSALLDALTKYAKDNGWGITEQDEISVIRKERKQMEETLSFAKQANNEKLISKCEYAISVMDEYLPVMMSEEQINAFVQDTVKRLGITNPTKADKGKIMKELSAIRDKADMKVVAQLVSAILQ